MKFEEALEKLKEINSKLDNPDISLDESIKIFGESTALAKVCLESLKETEGKITVIKEELDGLVEKPLDAEE